MTPHRPPLRLSTVDRWLEAACNGLRTLTNSHRSARPSPQSDQATTSLTSHEKQLSGALMRVNHVGEVCAQALYSAQWLTAQDEALQSHFQHAAQEETDHLAWTQKRLDELQCRTSALNPLWYLGAFGIGWIAGKAGRNISLGFVVETERQVEDHLRRHLDQLPALDHASRAIVATMQAEEARHAEDARRAGASELPKPVRWMMRAASKVMTTVAHHV